MYVQLPDPSGSPYHAGVHSGDVIFSTDPPPVYDEAREKFGVDFSKGIVTFVYGNTIHNAGSHLYPDVFEHELVHVAQQRDFKGGAEAWWRRYFDDKKFRFQEELAAYRRQYRWVLQNVKGSTQQFSYLRNYARSLASKMYGSIVDEVEAMRLISNTTI